MRASVAKGEAQRAAAGGTGRLAGRGSFQGSDGRSRVGVRPLGYALFFLRERRTPR
jgi:hypothetical protein